MNHEKIRAWGSRWGGAFVIGACCAGAIVAAACSAIPGEQVAEDDSETSKAAQPVQAPPGSPTPPGATFQRPEVGRLRNALGDIYCTGTLIHQQFVLTASHCAPYPDTRLFAGHTVAFTLANGSAGPSRAITDVWMLPNFPRFPLRANAPLNSDLMLLRLSSPITDFTPAVIAEQGMTAPGAPVSVFGYGGFGISPGSPCSNFVDGSKRAVNFNWGQPFVGGTGEPWPVCGGDSGGPTFSGPIPGGDLLSVTSNGQEGGSTVHFREEIYEQMRRMLGTNWVTGTARQGVVTATVTLPAGSPPSACESQCLSNLGCAAWSFFGNTCTLFSTAGRWLPAVPGPTIPTSGLRPVVQPNVARSGTPAFTTTTVSALHCASSANLAMRNAYDWNASTNQCRVFDVVGTAIPSTGMFSGVMQHLENGVDMPGSDIENPPPTTLSALSCALRCSQREECRAFSWNISSAVCRIKFATPPLQVGPGNVSGVKGTLPLPGVSLAGTEIATTGFKLAPNTNEYVPNPVRPEQCRADCASNASCVAYHLRRPRFFGSTWTCTLFSAVTAENPNPALFEAGYKGLDFF